MRAPPHPHSDVLAGFRHSGFFVLRTPLLPAKGLDHLQAGTEAASGRPAELEAAWSRDMSELRERLRRQMGRPEVREALFLASSDLYEECSQWLDDPDAECEDRMLYSLMRYFLRMSGRCTPFGLFASTSVGNVCGETRLEFGRESSFVRRTRLDMGFILHLVEAFQRDPAIRSTAILRKNSSLQVVADRGHYIATRLEQGYRRYVLESAEMDEALAEVLVVAGPGRTRAEIAAALVGEDVEHAEALAYVDSLIDAQVLVPDLQPALTGPGSLTQLMEALRRSPESAGPLAILEKVSASISRLDAGGLGAPVTRYREIEALCRELPADPKVGRLFQVDLGRVAPDARLDGSVVDDIGPAIEFLLRCSSDRTQAAKDIFADFRARFVERFGEREIPLLEALDEEVGIGFEAVEPSVADTSPLLQGLALFPADKARSVSWRAAQEVILPRLGEALASGRRMIDLTEADLTSLPPADARRLPDACVVALSMTDGGKGIELRGLYGPSGARMLGRFCHLDGQLLAAVRRHIAEEESLVPGAVFAEIVHLPEGRMGNVLARPLLRDYEIPFLGRSGAAKDREIPPDDLLVSVRGERILLRSKRLGREVIPRMSTAHNAAAGSLAPYRFLFRLQNQYSLEGLHWGWGPLESLPFLPGIRIGRVILSRPQWRLDRTTIKSLERARGAARLAAVRALCEERRLGRFVGVVDGDNVLPVDFENVLSVEVFVDLIAGRDVAVLGELDLSPEGLIAQGDGGYAHEILLPLVRRSAEDSCETRSGEAVEGRREPGMARRHGPGSDWTYAKIYTDPATADRMLREYLRPLVAALRDEGVLDRWFFIRYLDPGYHLRLRFKARPGHGDAVRARCDAILDRLLTSGATWRTQIDTYDPELVRYGGSVGIDLCERVFEVDSDSVLELLALASEGDFADVRWRLCLVGVDRLLCDFGYDLAGRHLLIRSVAQEFDREFGIVKQRRHSVRERLRKHRGALSDLLAGRASQSIALGRGLGILERRSALIEPIGARLKAAERDGLLSCTVSQIVTSLVHMHANRLLRSAHRAHEAMIYHFLERLYDSERARRTAPAEVTLDV